MKRFGYGAILSGFLIFAGTLSGQEQRPQVEVLFVLDTTGSMGGLIEGAKQKIWSIATAIAAGKPTPKLKVGLIAYRDVDDDYVTKIYNLTGNIDDIYEKLTSFEAGGGGDGPEHVNRALDEAIRKISWSDDSRNTLKIVYLVGDAPPHMDYKDGYHYKKTIGIAKQKGIIINTIQCGDESDTTPYWKEIAQLGRGRYVQIAQTGNVTVVETPYDQKLAELNDRYSETFIPYGREGEKREKEISMADESLRSTTSKASKASYQALNGGSYFGYSDLLNAIKEKKVDVNALKKSDLPDALRKLDQKDLKLYLKKRQDDRDRIQARILELGRKRTEYINEKSKKNRGKSFDGELFDMLKEQGKTKGIRF